MKKTIEVPNDGTIFVLNYPFVIEPYEYMEEDGVGKVDTWKPGVRFENTHDGDTDTYADGVGKQRIAVIAAFKPGKYPMRVFYTRKWIDPDGKEFGKGGMKISTLQAFNNIIGGYRYPFKIKRKTAA